jgi:hypothetical protein
MTRRLTLLLLAATLAGCGSGRKAAPPEPKLPVALAEQLAARSDKVAEALDAGDSCRALEEAVRLHRETIAATNAGRVPGPFQEQLGTTAQDLVSRIRCVPPPAQEENKDEDHRGKGEGRGKKGHG